MVSKTPKLMPIAKAAVDVTPMGILQIAVQQGANAESSRGCWNFKTNGNHARRGWRTTQP